MTDHSAPEVGARPARDEEIPRGARSIITLAEKHGWAVGVSYARGTDSVGRRPPFKVVDSIVVRGNLFTRAGEYWLHSKLSAHWIDGKFAAGLVIGGPESYWSTVTSRQLRAFIIENGEKS